MAAKFDFWEKIKINSPRKKIHNLEGYIVGMTDDKSYYSVTLGDTGAYVYEHELISLGEFIDPDTHWSGDSMTVTVDEKGRGSVKEYKSKKP